MVKEEINWYTRYWEKVIMAECASFLVTAGHAIRGKTMMSPPKSSKILRRGLSFSKPPSTTLLVMLCVATMFCYVMPTYTVLRSVTSLYFMLHRVLSSYACYAVLSCRIMLRTVWYDTIASVQVMLHRYVYTILFALHCYVTSLCLQRNTMQSHARQCRLNTV